MKRLALALLVLLCALPLRADWRQTATTRTWFEVRTTADATEGYAALLWYYTQQSRPADGAVYLAAQPQILLTDVGGGNSEISITMARSANDTWVDAYAPTLCPPDQTDTLAERLTCVDNAMWQQFKQVWQAYKTYLRNQAHPAGTPPEG